MPRLSERALVKRDLENIAVDVEDYSEIAEEIGLGPEFQYLSEIVAAARLRQTRIYSLFGGSCVSQKRKTSACCNSIRTRHRVSGH